jgi:hypothetical protein
MWKELVPDSGQAGTVQGELVRAMGRLTDEAYRNGNINFDDGHRLFCEFLRVNLNDSAVFSAEEINEINRSIERILDAEHPDVSGPETSFHRLSEKVVKWCESKPKLIPHQPNPALHR